jgi:hypothetical protein
MSDQQKESTDRQKAAKTSALPQSLLEPEVEISHGRKKKEALFDLASSIPFSLAPSL